MKLRKTICLGLAASTLFAFTACSDNTNAITSVTNVTTTTSDIVSTTIFESFATEDSDTASFETTTSESYDNSLTETLVEDTKSSDYIWNPYIWSDVLTDSFGESTRDTMFNCISAVMNGDDTFEYYDQKDLNVFFYLYDVICPYLSEIVVLPPNAEDGVVTLEYLCSKEEAIDIIDNFGREVESILNESIKETDTDEVKVMMIDYNYSKTLSYDYDFLTTNPSTYAAIMNRYGICNNFSKALVHFYLQAGIDAYLVKAHGPELTHMFVYMNLDGEDFYIDPTWESSRDGTGLSYFGVNTDFYNENDITADTLYLIQTEDFDGNTSSEKYKPLWYMKEINSITREDDSLIIDYIDSNGDAMKFIVSN